MEHKEIYEKILSADANYKPFPSFADWTKSVVIDNQKWSIYYASLKEARKKTDDKSLNKAFEVVTKAAAIDTGAIEGLYEVERGFTLTAAMEAAVFEKLLESNEKKTNYIKSQLDAYQYVLDFATKKQPVIEAWIRELHTEICKSQNTYRVLTAEGFVEKELKKGSYKESPNHVQTQTGEIHSYAPVNMVASEMERLCRELRGDVFENAHPVLQASYVHYSFVAIHPFSDGNGRVARALCSIYTYRSLSMPLLIFVEYKTSYFNALNDSDNGNFQSFIDFIFYRCIDAISLITESILNAIEEESDVLVSKLKTFYFTKGGYTHQQVDTASLNAFRIYAQKIQIRIKAVSQERMNLRVDTTNSTYAPLNDKYRLLITPNTNYINVVAQTEQPADASHSFHFFLHIPKNGAKSDEIIFKCNENDKTFMLRLEDIIPQINNIADVKMNLHVDRIIKNLVKSVIYKAEESFKKKGY
ncbi:MAG: Fic family protein [Bacteroidota bacterium]